MIPADGCRLDVPEPVDQGILDVLRHVQNRQAVTVAPVDEQLTTQTVANYLGVSRPFLVKLLEAGELPFHRVGTHRRVYLADLVRYQQRRDRERRESLNELARQTYDAGLYERGGVPEAGSDE